MIIDKTIDEEIFENFVREIVRDLNRRLLIDALVKRCLVMAGVVTIILVALLIF